MVEPSKYRILLVDDDARIRRAHARLVRALGYETEEAADGIEALAKLRLGVDLILLDAEMPGLDGFEVARRIRADERFGHLPIVMVTGRTDGQDRRRALQVGINDYVTKPLDSGELRLRSKWLLELKAMYDRLERQRADLEHTVELRTLDLRSALDEMTAAERRTHEAHLDTIRRLTIAAEYKDADTAGHIERIGLYSEVLGRALGMAPGETEMLHHAAPLHDVGKLGVPEAILLKPGKLDEAEWEIMRSHTILGAQMLADSKSPILQLGETIAIAHHERWDGTGYPNGLAGTAIPIEARICAVVDFFDALTMDRPYRKAVPRDEVLDMMREQRGRHFDQNVLDAFLDLSAEIDDIQGRHGSPP